MPVAVSIVNFHPSPRSPHNRSCSHFCLRVVFLCRTKKVRAVETPPPSPSEPRPPSPPPPAPSPSTSTKRGTWISTTSAPLALSPLPPPVNPAPEAGCIAAIPETQAPPQGRRGPATRRRGTRGQKSLPPPTASFVSIPETQTSPEACVAAAKLPAELFQTPPSDTAGTEARGRTRQRARLDGGVGYGSIPDTQASLRAAAARPDPRPPAPAQSSPRRGRSSSKRRRAQQAGGESPPPPASSVTIPETQPPRPEQAAPRPEGEGRATRRRSRGKAAVAGEARGESPSSLPTVGDGDAEASRRSDLGSPAPAPASSSSLPPPPPPSSTGAPEVSAAQVAKASAVSADVGNGREDDNGGGVLPTAGVGVEVGGRQSAAEASSVPDLKASPTTDRVGPTTMAAAVAAPIATTAARCGLGRGSDQGRQRVLAEDSEQQPARETSPPNGAAPSDSGHCDAVPHAEPPVPDGAAGDSAGDSAPGAGAPPEMVSSPVHQDACPESPQDADARTPFQPSPPARGAAAVVKTVEPRSSPNGEAERVSPKAAPGRRAGGEDPGRRLETDLRQPAAGIGAETSRHTEPEVERQQTSEARVPVPVPRPAPQAASGKEGVVGRLEDNAGAGGGGAGGGTVTPVRPRPPPTGRADGGNACEKDGGAAENRVRVSASANEVNVAAVDSSGEDTSPLDAASKARSVAVQLGCGTHPGRALLELEVQPAWL